MDAIIFDIGGREVTITFPRDVSPDGISKGLAEVLNTYDEYFSSGGDWETLESVFRNGTEQGLKIIEDDRQKMGIYDREQNGLTNQTAIGTIQADEETTTNTGDGK